jgi:hypothetical protein
LAPALAPYCIRLSDEAKRSYGRAFRLVDDWLAELEVEAA